MAAEVTISDLASDLLSEILVRCDASDRPSLSLVSKPWRATVEGDVRVYHLSVNLSHCNQPRLLSFFQERGAGMQTLRLSLGSPSALGGSTAQALLARCVALRSLHLEEAALQRCRLAPHLPQLQALSIGRLQNGLASHHRLRGALAEPAPLARDPLSLFQLRGLTRLAVGLSAHWVGDPSATLLAHLPRLTTLRELSLEAQWTRPYDATPKLALPPAITALQALQRLSCKPDIRFPAVGEGLLLPRLTHLEMSHACVESLSTARTRLRLSELKVDYLWLRDRELVESFVLLARSVPCLDLDRVTGNTDLARQLPLASASAPLLKLVLGRSFFFEADPYRLLQCLNLEALEDLSGERVCGDGRKLASVLSRCMLRAVRLRGSVDCKWLAPSVDALLHNSLPYLHTLQLKSVGLATVPPGLRGAPCLRTLDLSGNPLELAAGCVATLLALPALKSLCICKADCTPWPLQAQAAIQGLHDALVAAGSPHCLWCESGMGLRCYGLPAGGK